MVAAIMAEQAASGALGGPVSLSLPSSTSASSLFRPGASNKLGLSLPETVTGPLAPSPSSSPPPYAPPTLSIVNALAVGASARPAQRA